MSNTPTDAKPTQDLGRKEDDCSACSSSTGDDDDQNWDDWGSDSHEKQECPSLFDDAKLPSAAEALAYDKEKFGFDLDQVCSVLGAPTNISFRSSHKLRIQGSISINAFDWSTSSGKMYAAV